MAEEKLDKIYAEIREMSAKLVKMEVLIGERANDIEGIYGHIDRLENRVQNLESQKSLFTGGLGFAAWLVTAGIAVWGALK